MERMSVNLIIAQIMGVLAIIVLALAAHQRTKSKVLVCDTIAAVLYSIQYMFLFAYSAVAINIIGAIKDIIFYKYAKEDKEIPIILLCIYIVIIAISGIFTYTNIFSIFPTILSILYAYGVWQSNLKVFRGMSIFIASAWFIYNLSVGAYVSVAGNMFQLVSAIIAVIRLDIMKTVEHKQI